MKVFFFLFVFATALPTTLLSQDTLFVYFDKDWNKISNKDVAVFYRKAYMDSEKVWNVNDFFKSDKIQMSGTYDSKSLKLKHGNFIYYYENGMVESEGRYVNDKSEGVWNYWYENGKLLSCGSFINDLKEGKWTYWYENGSIKSEGMYKKGNHEGDWVYYFDNGNIKSMGKYVNGLSEGIWEYRHERGEKKAEGKYVNDNMEGIWNYWYANGQLKYVETYTKGEMVYIKGYHENGKINFQGDFIKGKKLGQWTYTNADGRVFLKGAYNSKGNQEGVWMRYFPEGEMKVVYLNGILQGKEFGGISKTK